jgi:hypothetical protein
MFVPDPQHPGKCVAWLPMPDLGLGLLGTDGDGNPQSFFQMQIFPDGRVHRMYPENPPVWIQQP